SSEILLGSLSANDPLIRHVNNITVASEQAASLTRQLLTFSRKQAFSPIVFDLNSIVIETGQMLPRIIGEHIEIVVVPSAEQALVLADRSQAQQVLLNLAANARDAMPKGGKLSIRVATTKIGSAARAGEPAGVAPGNYVM